MFRKTIFMALALGALALGVMPGEDARAAGRDVSIAGHDGLIWADVESGGRTLHFVVDTGAASSCVDLAAAKRLGLKLGDAIRVAGVGGATTGYECAGFQARMAGMRLPADVVVLDLSGPSRGCREEIDGLIGADFFQGKVIRIDYARKLLTREDTGVGARGTPLRIEDGVICVPVAVNGEPARWTRLDTGCTDALYWCDGADCKRKGAGKSVALASWTGGAVRADVTVGSARMKDVPVRVRDRAIFPGEAGLLGNGALSQYRVTIDGIRKRVMLDAAE